MLNWIAATLSRRNLWSSRPNALVVSISIHVFWKADVSYVPLLVFWIRGIWFLYWNLVRVVFSISAMSNEVMMFDDLYYIVCCNDQLLDIFSRLVALISIPLINLHFVISYRDSNVIKTIFGSIQLNFTQVDPCTYNKMRQNYVSFHNNLHMLLWIN